MSSELQKKLTAFEADPPGRIWEAISASMDRQEAGSYTERLLKYEVSPPSGLWAKIQSQLGQLEKYDPGVIPFYKKYSRHLKYSGVAAVIVTFGIISSLLISKKTKSEVTSEPIVHQTSQAKENFSIPEDLPLHTHNSSVTSIYMKPGILQEKIARQLRSTSDNTMALLEQVAPKFAQRKHTINFSMPSEAYMIYSDGKGNAVRLPKRLYDAFACPDDKITCREQLKKLQEKIASSSVTSDLTGILEMLNNLQENQ
jgi:transcriptional regulator